MDISHIDPHMTQQIADLGVRLGETAVRNTAGAIADQIKKIKTERDSKVVIQQLEEIITNLIDDKNETVQIAKAYEEEFVAQKISQKDIEYITESVIPVLKSLLEQFSSDQNSTTAANAISLEKTLEIVESLLSVKMLTVLQLVGFNYKQAIGEPLTLLLQKFITSKISLDTQSALENNKLTATHNMELMKIAQDQEAFERWMQLRSN